ncbi:MAG: circularly permuted type 2 ATP-grasp protein [Pseudomonadota bacterium]|nr:circularly permuted type 2 ATP-grasp protein [Pseudomonadota bacterium]
MRSQKVRNLYKNLDNWLSNQNINSLMRQSIKAEELFRKVGITFNVYGEDEAEERLIPFDLMPRIIDSKEWSLIEKGITQRLIALNMFLEDIYSKQNIVKENIIPSKLINNNAAFLPEMCNFKPPGGIYTHISGIDLVRTSEKNFFVLEDNLRVPSGASYMIENRSTMMHMFPELFTIYNVKPVFNYPDLLLKSLVKTSKSSTRKPNVAVLTPGVFNSAYYEHTFLADEMGVNLLEWRDLLIEDNKVVIRTTQGIEQVDIIYRRIDDTYLDPLSFNPDSRIGSPGLFDVYRAGNVMIANAPGTGIADDKAVYSYIPEIIKFYLDEEPILKNVKTWRCSEKKSLKYVIDNLDKLVVKEVHGSGGYGMLIGPTSSKKEIENFKQKLISKPSNYIAQPTLSLSSVPILTKKGLAPRHVDLRPFALMSPNDIKITNGGLSRVALKENSLLVNSSQGGGTKDTWIVDK